MLASDFEEYWGRLSPDGRYVAYESDGTGESEVSVLDLTTRRPIPVSRQGGNYPRCSHDGTELYFNRVNAVMAAAVTSTDAGLEFAEPVTLFDLTTRRGDWFAEPAPGDRFLGLEWLEVEDPANRQINIRLNWFEELKQRVPTGR